MPVVKDIIKNDTGEDVTIYIEVADQSVEPIDSWGETRGTITDQVQDAFQRATTLIHTCAEQIAQSIHSIPAKVNPQEFEVQFAVKFDTRLGAVIAQASSEAQIQVTLRWGTIKED
jgi:hypothetical protein